MQNLIFSIFFRMSYLMNVSDRSLPVPISVPLWPPPGSCSVLPQPQQHRQKKAVWMYGQQLYQVDCLVYSQSTISNPFGFTFSTLFFRAKVWRLENNTNLTSIFCLRKSSEIVPIFYLHFTRLCGSSLFKEF